MLTLIIVLGHIFNFAWRILISSLGFTIGVILIGLIDLVTNSLPTTHVGYWLFAGSVSCFVIIVAARIALQTICNSISPETRKKLMLNLLSQLNLEQDKPRLRTIILEGKPTPIQCPYVSIGCFGRTKLFVFVHNRPWKTYQGALRYLNVPIGGHTLNDTGLVCLGDSTRKKLQKGELTPSQAYWFSDFVHHDSGRLDYMTQPDWAQFLLDNARFLKRSKSV